MTVIKENPAPLYVEECPECKSVITYKRSEICNHHITCPVCNVGFWANCIKVKDECKEAK